MDEENRVHKYCGTLFILKKKRNPATCNNMDEPGDIVLSEISQM
jgi:hypothetical protein